MNAEQLSVRFTISREVLAKLQRALELLGHRVAPNDVPAVFERALDALLPVLEREKFAATDRPRAQVARSIRAPQPARSTRTISAAVKRAVWQRDGGRCTFVNAHGRRCTCKRALEFDHMKPVAVGGAATTENVQLLCAHNQYEAERRFGAEFMRARRERARSATRSHALTATAHEPDRRPAESAAALHACVTESENDRVR